MHFIDWLRGISCTGCFNISNVNRTIHIVLKYLVAKLILAADTVSVCKNDLSFLYNSLLITVVLK